ncbi:MAG: RidA family protein [Alphaproteobacteria bacterium]|nr:RidA family protein [Alphaproteobacteria bacterium]
MSRRLISSGSKFESILGYSRAVVDGEWVFLSGTTGFDYKAHTIHPGVIEQTEQMLDNMAWGLKQAGARFEDVVRLRLYMTHWQDFERVAPVIGKRFCHIRPAQTMITASFADPRILIEMEATALLRGKAKPVKAAAKSKRAAKKPVKARAKARRKR